MTDVDMRSHACCTYAAGSEAYEARKQSPEEQEEYLSVRLPQWLANLETFFAETNAFAGGGSFFFGANPSCALPTVCVCMRCLLRGRELPEHAVNVQ
jgi:hypothetical protein